MRLLGADSTHPIRACRLSTAGSCRLTRPPVSRGSAPSPGPGSSTCRPRSSNLATWGLDLDGGGCGVRVRGVGLVVVSIVSNIIVCGSRGFSQGPVFSPIVLLYTATRLPCDTCLVPIHAWYSMNAWYHLPCGVLLRICSFFLKTDCAIYPVPVLIERQLALAI